MTVGMLLVNEGFHHDMSPTNDLSDDGDLAADDRENVEEAIHHVNTALLPSQVG